MHSLHIYSDMIESRATAERFQHFLSCEMSSISSTSESDGKHGLDSSPVPVSTISSCAKSESFTCDTASCDCKCRSRLVLLVTFCNLCRMWCVQ